MLRLLRIIKTLTDIAFPFIRFNIKEKGPKIHHNKKKDKIFTFVGKDEVWKSFHVCF